MVCMIKEYFYIAVATALVGGAIAAFSWLGVPGQQAPLATQSEVVELKNGDTYDLVASPVKKEIGGKTYTMLAYNGSIPGPIIKAVRGSEVTINLKNDTDMPTTLHAHGVRMENKFDGVPGVTQEAIPPGGSFSYTLKFLDVGMYWYHPHVRTDYAMELGLYGVVIVDPERADYWNPVNQEIPLAIDDILIEDGEIILDKERVSRTLMGRFGNVMLTNGETDYTLNANRGEVARFFIVNAANARTFNIAIPGVQMKLVGGDNGAYEREEWKDAVLLGPGERAVVEALFEKSGTFTLEHRTPQKTYTLGRINVSDTVADVSYAPTFHTLKTNTDTVKSIDPFRPYFAKKPDKNIALSIDMMGGMMNMRDMARGAHMMADGSMMGGSRDESVDGIEWEDTMATMNTMSDATMVKWNIIDQDTKKANMTIDDWTFKVGDKVKIRIFNDPKSAHPMQHPIHIHGQRFLVLSLNGVPETNLVWKDTTFVRIGETVDIFLDASNPGTWVAHCHILEHAEAGMMFTYKVF